MAKKQMVLNEMKKKMNWLKENTDYHVAFMCLQGSQNYGFDEYTDDYSSDFDVKCFIIPTLKDLLERPNMISKELVMNDKSHIEVKDIRLLGNLLYKMNPTYLELLYTPYFYVNKEYQRVRTLLFLKSLKEMSDDISNRDVKRFVKSMQGFIYEKRKGLEKRTDSGQEIFDIYKYNPKQLHHLARLSEMVSEVARLDGKVNFESLMNLDFLSIKEKNKIKKYKTAPIEYSEAIYLADTYVKKAECEINKLLENNSLTVNDITLDKLNSLIEDYVSDCVKIDVIKSIQKTNQEKKGAKADSI